jgi:hypothetical protein
MNELDVKHLRQQLREEKRKLEARIIAHRADIKQRNIDAV